MLISSRTVLVFVKVGGSIPGPEAQRPRKISENSGRHLATAAAGCRHRRATAGDALEMFEAWAQATDEEEERSDTVRRWWLRRLDHGRRRRRRSRVELGLRGFYAAGHRGSIYISRAAGIDRTFPLIDEQAASLIDHAPRDVLLAT